MKDAEDGNQGELVTLRVKARMHQSAIDRYEARLEDLQARNKGLAQQIAVSCSIVTKIKAKVILYCFLV